MFHILDANFTYPIRLKWLGEGTTLEPGVAMYNFANFRATTVLGTTTILELLNADPSDSVLQLSVTATHALRC